MQGHNSKRTTGIDEILEEQAHLCMDWADAKAEVERLENRKKTILAVAKSGEGTNAAKEDFAYKSDAYSVFVREHAEAVKREAYLRARRDYLNVEFERWRTDRADTRAVTKGA